MRVGDVLDDRYQLVRKLGQGGFGVVWEAEDTRMERLVAVKVIGHDGGDRAKAALRFVREAHAAGQLSHPHIVTVHDLGQCETGEDREVTFLVMELLVGRTLTQVLRDGLPEPKQSLRWGQQICEALAAAHDAGMVHRDIKPDNVMITEAGRLKVLDFGIAQLDSGTGGLTTVGTVIGSPAYMAPERWTGDRVDGRADLYAVGCLLVELCTGTSPFAGDSTPVLMYQHLNEVPPALDPDRYGLPAQLPALVAQLLAKDPNDRPADARTVAGRLADLADGKVPPEPAPKPAPAPEAEAEPEVAPAPAPPRTSPPGRRAPVRPVRPRGLTRHPKEPNLRPVGRPALLYPEPPPRFVWPEPPARVVRPAPVEDAVVLRARLTETVRAVRDERPAKAVYLLQPVVDAAAGSLGATDPEVVTARRDLARYFGRAGQRTRAVRVLEGLVEDLNSALGPVDPQVLEVRYDLTELVRDSGETVTAIRLLTELLPVLRGALGPRGPLVFKAWQDLATCQARRRDYQAAVLQLTDMVPRLDEAFGVTDRRSMRARADLAEYRKRARFHGGPARTVRAWRVRIDRDEALRLVRRLRSGGDPQAARALERGTGAKGVAERVASAPFFVTDEDLVTQICGS
ncbi:serine/threonine-protein kinase [Kitasatospora brasiliensis]|uniref:serine/threonine-protein kinase n=1 Tax=Kitasatospora brasiliensis TaxID=3058040 RepID=UPI002930F868|nr:serine/threonine-protein kinase [Kitasatospora sp. K002]